MPPPGLEEDDTTEFSKLLLEITDQLEPDSFVELYHFLKELCCPDGSRYVPAGYLKGQLHSPEALLIPLLSNNLLASHDLDLLVAILRGLGQDQLLPLLRDYSAKLTVGLPGFRPVQDQEKFFSLLVELEPRATELDLEGVCYVKRELCELLGVESSPFLLQFLGWRKPPIMVQFQAHVCLVDRVRELGSRNGVENFTKFEVDIRGSVFVYDLTAR